MSENQTTTFEWSKFASTNWFKKPEQSSIWISAYECAKLSPEDLPNGFKIIDLKIANAVIVNGQLKFHENDEILRLSPEGAPNFSFNVKEKETEPGIWLVFIIPFKVDGVEGDSANIKFIISALTGFLSCLIGRNIVYRNIFNQIVHFEKKETQFSGPTYLNPLALPKPAIGGDRTNLIEKIFATINNITEPKKNKIVLSLHWYEQGEFSVGIDSFLKIWIALEVLGMDRTTNIRPLNEILAKGYAISIDRAKNKYGIGIIYGFRSRIVHDGEKPPITCYFLDYIKGIYLDILLTILDFPIEGRAEEILKGSNFELRNLL